MTADQLLHTNVPDKRTELIRGVLVVREPAGYDHGRVTMNLTWRLGSHIDLTGAGQLLAAETGFTLFRDPDTVRAPDIAFVSKDRVPSPGTTGFVELAPDLVVEVLSPDDRPGETLAKIRDWLEAGTRLVGSSTRSAARPVSTAPTAPRRPSPPSKRCSAKTSCPGSPARSLPFCRHERLRSRP